jgi:hypothetical protein
VSKAGYQGCVFQDLESAQKRIAELEAQLAKVQASEGGGVWRCGPSGCVRCGAGDARFCGAENGYLCARCETRE